MISNAINASDSGEITINIDKQLIEVIDMGRGLNASESDSNNGHGLGLLIVDSLCQRYQWQFTLENIEPAGCRSRLILPIAER